MREGVNDNEYRIALKKACNDGLNSTEPNLEDFWIKEYLLKFATMAKKDGEEARLMWYSTLDNGIKEAEHFLQNKCAANCL